MATASHTSTDANSNNHAFTTPNLAGRVSPVPGKPKLLAPLIEDREINSVDMSALGKAKADILL
jgi:hypothetical protein